jgi:hypothetical protein
MNSAKMFNKKVLILLAVLLSGITLLPHRSVAQGKPYDATPEVLIACANARLQTGSAKCMCHVFSGVGRDYRIEALCLFAEDSALAGEWPANPIAGDAVADYAKAHSESAALAIGTGKRLEYFNSSLSKIHECYATYKINMCNTYHAH